MGKKSEEKEMVKTNKCSHKTKRERREQERGERAKGAEGSRPRIKI